MATNTATQADHQVLEFDLEEERYVSESSTSTKP